MCADSAYGSIVTRQGLSEILGGADLQLTPSGGIQLGNDRHNAMHRLVVLWASNWRALDTLFDLVGVDRLRKAYAEAEREAIAAEVVARPELTKKFHALGEEVRAGEFGSAACAGAIMVVLNNLLQRYRTDLRRVSPKWGGIGPPFNGKSLGEVVEAASNNFRHHDEWAAIRGKPTKQQKKSIAVIEAVLVDHTPLSPAFAVPWRRNACAELLFAVVGGSDFATLEQRFFEFAKAMQA